MKIALAHKRLDLKGGTERDLYKTAEGLRDLGHEVHLFCAEFAIDPPADTFAHRLLQLPLGRTARLWSLATRGAQTIRKYGCDVVMGFGRLTDQDVVRSGGGTHRGFLERLGRQQGMRRRLWQRVSLYHQSVLTLEKRQFSRGHYKKIVAVSNEVKRDIIEHYDVPAARVEVLYNGVDHERFQPSLRAHWRSRIRQDWQIPEQAQVVLFVGSGFRRKGLDRLLAVWNFPDLHDVYLLVVGQDARLGQYRARASEIAGDRIRFAGWQDAVERYYGAADVVALPSVQEAFGNIALEGLASGLPVVVADGVGAAEVLQGEFADGVVKSADDPQELTTKIAGQLRRSRNPACALEARALAERYSWQNYFCRLENVLIEARALKQCERVS